MELKFGWSEIPDREWNVVEDPDNGIRDAVMLYENITADDTKLDDGKYYLTIHRRIKIFNAEGRKWGDVTLPAIHAKQDLEVLEGRTLRPDGVESYVFESVTVDVS